MAIFKATRRNDTGTRKVRRMRKNALTPGVIYGHKKETIPVSLNHGDVERAVLRGERLLEIELDGTPQNVLIKEVQYDHLGGEILHIDLARVNLDEWIKVTVPIVLKGTPAGALEQGVLQQISASVDVECQVRSIPEEIRVNVSEMKLGDVMNMKDIQLPEGVKLVSGAETIVCTVRLVAEEVAAPTEEAAVTAAEPEVIGEKKEEETEGQEAPEKE